ncbi:uridylate kinase [Tundrisphaera lichenicola]|uniref:amino acid kinase family protein n=1 Tax=Tundrisphaera lichenicola TaxID=2029860 RepID=UPI003EBFACB7
MGRERMIAPVVVKVGGSLLDWPDLSGRLSAYLESRQGDRIVLIVGGGRFADALRDLDRTHGLGEARSHALALRVLDSTAHVLAAIVPGLSVVETLDNLGGSWAVCRAAILAPRRFLDEDDRSSDPLPHAWATTTDAIAARVAVRLGARELILLKSTPIPLGLDLESASRIGLIDPETPRVAAGLPAVLALNLREPAAIPVPLLSRT